MKKQIMVKAWKIAENMSVIKGGTKKEWIAFGMHRAWVLFKEGNLVVEATPVKKSVTTLKGGMTSKQDWFITKLMKEVEALGIDVINTVDGVIEYLQNGVYGTTKQEASELIGALLDAKKVAA